MESGNLDSKK